MYEHEHLGCCYIKSSLYKRFLNWNRIFKKSKVVTDKTQFFVIGPFRSHHSVCLSIGNWYGNFFGNEAFSILVLSTKKTVHFLKKVLILQKICFKVKILKTFKIFTDCYIKACRPLKRRAILKTPSTAFQKNLWSFCWL